MKATGLKMWVVAMLAFAVNANAADIGELNPETGENWKLGDSVKGKISEIGDDKETTICNQGKCDTILHLRQTALKVGALKVGDHVNCKAAGYECGGFSWDCAATTP